MFRRRPHVRVRKDIAKRKKVCATKQRNRPRRKGEEKETEEGRQHLSRRLLGGDPLHPEGERGRVSYVSRERGREKNELVESGTGTVPSDLTSVEGVGKGDVLGRAATREERVSTSRELGRRRENALLVVEAEGDGGTLGEVLHADDVNLVLGLDLLVVGGVLEVKREHTLLLEVGPERGGKRVSFRPERGRKRKRRTRGYERRSG